MRTRIAVLATVLAIGAAACGTEPAVVERGITLRYAYEPGDALAYEARVAMDMRLEADGPEELVGGVDASMSLDATTRMDYAFTEGPDPETTALHLSAALVDGSATVTADGQTETIPFDDVAEMTGVEMDLVVGPTGEIESLHVEGQEVPLGLLGDSLTGIFGQGFQPPNIGPILPNDPVAVGSTWSTDQSIDMWGIGVEISGEHTLAAEEVLDGRATQRIESVTVMGAVDVDLIAVLAELITLAGAEDLGADPAELELALTMFEAMGTSMRLHLDETRTEAITWFDAAAGVVVRQESAAEPMTMRLELSNIPDVAGDIVVTAEISTLQEMELLD